MPVTVYTPYVLVGTLTRDFVISQGGIAINDKPGGHLLYSALGLHQWEKGPGLISRIGNNYPEEWLEKMRRCGMNTNGIKRLDKDLEHRSFISYLMSSKKERVNILSSYVSAGLAFPRGLLGYSLPIQQEDSDSKRSDYTIIYRDIPAEYLESRCVHICPMDFLTHNLLPQVFRTSGEKTITLEAGRGYMVPRFFERLAGLVNGLSAFITSEQKLRKLFSEQHKVTDLLEMAEIVRAWGVENVVIRRNDRSTLLLNRLERSYFVQPPYSENGISLTGETSAFCGGFLAGLNETYDPVRALVYGAVAASLICESAEPFSSIDILPGLLQARMEVLAEKQQKFARASIN